jgi:uncharacterized membrane protein
MGVKSSMADETKTARKIFVNTDKMVNTVRDRIQNAFGKFLGIPFLLLILFLILAGILIFLENANPPWIQSVRQAVTPYLLATPDKTSAILGTIASGLITQNSIVISILLLVLQRVAGSMGNLIYDQYLRRHRNQVYLGFVMGLILLILLLSAAIKDSLNPVFSALIILGLTASSFFLLIWFLYSAVYQMRPETVVNEIHDNVIAANADYQKLMQRCRKESVSDAPIQATLYAKDHGYVSQLKLDKVEKCLEGCDSDTEIIAHFQLGNFLSDGSQLFSIRSHHTDEIEALSDCLKHAIVQEDQMTIVNNPKYGLRQMEAIAWTEGSTARQNPETSLMVLHGMQSILGKLIIGAKQTYDVDQMAFVYDDSVIQSAANVLESLAVVSSASLQHQIFAQVLENISLTYPFASQEVRHKFNDVIGRILSAMGDHVLTEDLEKALWNLSGTLSSEGNWATAQMVDEAREKLSHSVGQLASRSTRVKAE